MRILHINDYEHMAGAETAVRMLMEAHQKRGHQTYLFTTKQIGGVLVPSFLKEKKLEKIFKSLKPNIIHLHNNSMIGLAPLYTAKKLGIPVVWTLHDYRILCKNTMLFRGNATICKDTLFCPACNDFPAVANFKITDVKKANDSVRFVVASNYVRKRFSAILDAEKIYWDADENLLKKKTEHKRGKKILFGGRKDPEKGIHYVMAAFKRLLQSHPDATLIFAGESRDSNLRKTAKIYGVENNIKEAGLLSRDTYLELMADVDIVVCASVWAEPFNLTLLEAMALGKQIIATNVGGQPEVLGDGGILVNPKSSIEIADAMRYFFNDKVTAKKFSKKARSQAEKFKGGSDKYLKIYQELL